MIDFQVTPERAKQLLENAKFADKPLSSEVKKLAADLCEYFDLDCEMLYRYICGVAASEKADEISESHVREAAKHLIASTNQSSLCDSD